MEAARIHGFKSHLGMVIFPVGYHTSHLKYNDKFKRSASIDTLHPHFQLSCLCLLTREVAVRVHCQMTAAVISCLHLITVLRLSSRHRYFT